MSASWPSWMMLAPGKEPADRMQVGHASVPVADRGGEEFQEAARGVVTGVGDDRRHNDLRRDCAGDPQLLVGRNDGQLVARFGFVLIHGFSVT